MKYLVLFLLVMFSCNVNADVSYTDVYLTLSEHEKQMFLNQCRLENFHQNATYVYKGNVCIYAAKYTFDKTEDPYYFRQHDELFYEAMRYLVKAGNFHYLGKIDSFTNGLIYDYYDIHKCYIKPHQRICAILKGYKGLNSARKRGFNR